MSVRASYSIRIWGVSNQQLQESHPLFVEFNQLFGQQPTKWTGPINPHAPFPQGILLPGYDVCSWRVFIDPGGKPNEDRVSFRAEFCVLLPGTIYQHRNDLKRHVGWFYDHLDNKWHDEISKRLNDPNGVNGLNDKHRHLLKEAIQFREWQWYCGNGGGT